ncbi:MAG: TfoX/Sxy family protein [Chthonomonas sp.]|nr:TfoX/Sxy family protein [Chthonomonas sp.]
MPLTKEVFDSTVAVLQGVRPVTWRKMFGGAGFYVDGVFFALLDDDRLFFKVDDHSKGEYEERGMEPWVWDGNVSDAYRELPEEIMASDEQLGLWIDEAVQAAIRRKSKTKTKKSK